MKLRNTLALLLLLPFTAWGLTTSQLFGFRSVTDSTYGATCGTTSDDSAAFQNALNAASTAGGGTVYVPACSGSNYYYFLTALSIPSNVRLQCQAGAVLKPRQDDPPTAAVSGATSLIGFYGVSNAGIDGCTIDTTAVTTDSEQPNPIEVGPAAPWTDATRSSGISITNNRILSDSHANGPYMIWMRLANNVRVLNNSLEGTQSSYTASTDNNGIEVIAGSRIEIAGNRISNVGRYGIIVGAYSTGTFASYHSTDINIHDNTVQVAHAGVALEPASDGSGNESYLANIRVAGNVITDPWLYGMRIGISGTVSPSTAMYRSVMIANNTVNMGVLTQNPVGFWLNFGSDNGTASGFNVVGNSFYGGKTTTAYTGYGLVLDYAKNVRFVGNSWTGGDTGTATTFVASITGSHATSNVHFIGNYFGPSGGGSLYAGLGDNYVLNGNTFDGWGVQAGSGPAIEVGNTANKWSVVGNTFIKGATEGYPMHGTGANGALAVGWLWRSNLRQYTVGFNYEAAGIWSGTVSTPSSPSGSSAGTVAAVNSGNIGAFRLTGTGSYTAVTVNNTQVRSGSRIALTQIAGDIVAYRVAATSGAFTVTLASDPSADVDFQYEIFN